MKEILFLTTEDSAPGFALTGIHQEVVNQQETWEKIQLFCQDPSIGVIAVDDRLLEKIEPSRLHELTERWPGVLVTLPAPAGGRVSPIDELQRLVQRALGYHVRLKK